MIQYISLIRAVLVKSAEVVTWFSNYDVARPDTPPWWTGWVPPLRRLWQNPVSQFNYRRGNLIAYPLILVAFVGSFIYSLFLNLAFTMIQDENIAFLMGFYVTVALPVLMMTLFAVIRIFVTCHVGTSIRIRRWLESGLFSSVLPTPLSDARIFNGMLFPGLIRGLVLFEMMLGLSFGLVLAFVLVMGRFFQGSSIIDIGDILRWLPTAILWFLTAPILFTCLLTYASGLYSLVRPTVTAVLLALGHIALILGFTALIRLGYHALLSNPEPGTLLFFLGELLQVGVLTGLSVLTARIGVMVFARYRRPGFNETEWASAARFASWD